MNDNIIDIVAGLLTVFFVFASSIKILGWHKLIFTTQLEFFKKYGLNRPIMMLVGIVELAGAILLWLPEGLRAFGAALLLATSIGALFFHLRFDTWRDGIPSIITGVLSGLVVHATYSTLIA